MPADTPPDDPQSPLPFNAADLTKLRVRPAELARMFGVSKQCVSQWVKQGKVSAYPDGSIDPAGAAREVVRNTDPGRLRAKIFKALQEDTTVLQSRIAGLEAELAEARKRIVYLDGFIDELARGEELLADLLNERESELRATPDSDAWGALVEDLRDVASMAAGPDDQDVQLGDETETMVAELRRAADSQAIPAGSSDSIEGRGDGPPDDDSPTTEERTR